MLVFKPEKHEYLSTDGTDVPWISVTSFISQFKKPFDAVSIAQKVSKNKKSKWYGMTPKEIQDAWSSEGKRATDLGTWYHNQREVDICGLETMRYDNVDVQVFKPLVNEDGSKMAPDQKLGEGIYPEHMVYLKSMGLCGQSDLVEVVNGYVRITDYKTNKEIKKESFKNWDGVSQKMLAPVAHLDDCNFNHYALQLSLYMYMIIKHNPMLKPGKMVLHHVTFEQQASDQYGNPIAQLDSHGDPIVKDIIVYEVPYMKQEVISIINWLKDNRHQIKPKK